MTYLRNYLDMSQFDEITRFRIINLILVSIAINLMMPILVDLRGELLTATFISFIMIVSTLAIKTNKYLVRFTKNQLFHLGVVVHLAFLLASLTYFWDPLVFVYLDSFIAIAEIAVFSSFSVKLNTYLAEYFPEKMEAFQVYRNSVGADGTLIGLSLAFFATMFYGNTGAIVVYLVFNTLFSMWLFTKWNFIQEAMERLGE